MLSHGSAKLVELAARCTVLAQPASNGWDVDVWDMCEADVDLAVECYQSVLAADLGPEDPVLEELAAQGIDLLALLADHGKGRELVTRSDIAEFAAAASVIATDGFDTATMLMPNIPKMSRRKSDSGVDVFDVRIDTAAPAHQLVAGERLGLASVKHTLTDAASSLRRDIERSIDVDVELTPTYVAQQLRVVMGQLQDEGMAKQRATRTFLFMTDFPDPAHVGLLGVAVVAPELRQAMLDQLHRLPPVVTGRKFRIVTFPGLADVHLRCP
jgi:hypothetical protein